MQQKHELAERRDDSCDGCHHDCHKYCLATDAIELGRGMSGVVFRIPSCESWAFKCFKDTAAYSQEKHTARQIVHRIHWSGDHRLLHHLALPHSFCDNHRCSFVRLLDPQSDLERILTDRDRRWTLGEAKETAVAVCNIVLELHSSGIVHGDLKAKNINISLTGPILLDFGLSTLSSSTPSSSPKVSSSAHLYERDQRQLLQLILQLRFRLPLLTVYEGDLSGEIVAAGLLVFDGDADDDDERDSRWEVSPTVYVLAGHHFDALMATTDAEEDDFIKRTYAFIDDIFDGDRDATVCCHRADLWAAFGGLTALLDANHKELISMVTRCGQRLDPNRRNRCTFIDRLRSTIDEALSRFTRRLRQLLSVSPVVIDDGGVQRDMLAHLHSTIHQSFATARGILSASSSDAWNDADAADAITAEVSRCFSAA